MSTIDLKKNKKRPVFGILILLAAAIAACSSDDEVTPEEEPEEEVVITTGVYTLKNLVTDSAATYATGAKPLYYSLEDGKIIPASQAQTDRWDICFNGSYNSSICANNGRIETSPGYGGPGKGAIYMTMNSEIDADYYNGPDQMIKHVPDRALFDQAFNAVTTADVADGKWDSNSVIGLDYFVDKSYGWGWYDFYGQLFPDKPYALVEHVVYALPRTLIVRTAKGNYAKVVIYSLYKDAPDVPDRTYKPGFVTLKYAIQKDGSANLDIKE